jgi:DNA repair exonuclease SbcCD nuclease subunit
MPPVRFIHTSDIHLDTSLAGAGFPSRLGDRKREAIRATLRRILDDARSQALDFVLIAGDLFEHDRVTPDSVEFLKQQFSDCSPARIFIAPGNHDPCLRGSPYCEENWPGNVHIFRDEQFRSVELPNLGTRITGFGYNHARLQEPRFRDLPVLADDLVNVVVAHGSDTNRIPGGKAVHGPLTIEEIAGKNVRYCALGHYHQQGPVPNTIDGTQVWYSGIPEGRGWDEEGPCAYLLVEIDQEQVRVESRPCNQIPFRTLEVDCDGFSSREQIIDAILAGRDSSYDSTTILRVRLRGELDPKLDLSLSEMEERLAGLALHLQWDDRTESTLDFDLLAREGTLAGQFVCDLNERIANVSESERPALVRARLYGVQALLGREVRLK